MQRRADNCPASWEVFFLASRALGTEAEKSQVSHGLGLPGGPSASPRPPYL